MFETGFEPKTISSMTVTMTDAAIRRKVGVESKYRFRKETMGR